jgi:pimeloyl-ACP methyl ester carboxylesterase
MASAEDMLFGHLDRLPQLAAGQRIERLPYDPPAKLAAIVQFLRELPCRAAIPAETAGTPAGADPAVQFVDTPDCQIFIRCYGNAGLPAVFLLHDAPGTGLALEAMARAISSEVYVIVPDLPGCGESSAPPEERSVIDSAVAALSVIADTLGLERYGIAASGCGAVIAASSARGGDRRLQAIIIEDVPIRSEATAAAIAPELPLSPDGAHWIRAWLMLRDNQIYKPWFDGSVAAQRQTQGIFDADWLHDQTFDLMKSRATYHRYPREAFRFDVVGALSAAAVRVEVAPEGELEPLVRATVAPG